jgi:hypothetical protein
MRISTMNLLLNPEDGLHPAEICASGTAVVTEPLG